MKQPNHADGPCAHDYPCPLDFAAAWHACTAQDPDHRGDAAVDLAYWQRHASGYDQHSHSPGHYEATLAAIRARVRPTDTLLDVGAGAGRFALPLADHVQRVTALDHARPMLDRIEQKMRRQQIRNIDLVERAWEAANIAPHDVAPHDVAPRDVAPHDVVLAAWSLYRLPDILAGVHKLVAATRRVLLIVSGAGHSLHHDPLLHAIWPNHRERDTPMHLYFHGVFWQAGVHADLVIINERRHLHAPTPLAMAQQLAPAQATTSEIVQLASALTPRLLPSEHGWCYEQLMPVGLSIWQATE